MHRLATLAVFLSVIPAIQVLAEDPVYFEDPDLKEAVEIRLGVTDPTPTDMLSLIWLQADGVFSLVGLEYATNLRTLYARGICCIQPYICWLTDIEPLSGLTSLEYLWLGKNKISDPSPLSGLVNLKTLDLHGNQITSADALAGLTELTELDLSENQITNASALAGLTALESLNLYFNQISSVALSGLSSLETLNLSSNQTTSASLSDLPSLISLYLDHNQMTSVDLQDLPALTSLELDFNQLASISISDLPSLASLNLHENQLALVDLSNLPALESVDLSHNDVMDLNCSGLPALASLEMDGGGITDISFLADLAGLPNLRSVYLQRNEITDLSPLAGLTSLEQLSLWNNQIADLSPLAGLVNLSSLEVTRNQIVSLDSLAAMTSLRQLDASENQIVSISALAGLANLEKVSLGNNQITDIAALADATSLTYLSLGGNPLSATACEMHLPLIIANNPGLYVSHPCSLGYILTIIPAEGGTVTRSPDKASYENGEEVTLTAVPDSGYVFSEWLGDASNWYVENPTTVTMRQHRWVSAVFEPLQAQYTLTTIISPSGAGSVNRSPNKSAYDSGEQVTLTATPADGYAFAGWSGDLSGTANPETVAMDSNKSITATFEPVVVAHTLTTGITPAGTGSVSRSPNKSTYAAGETVTLTATPAEGYTFAGWSGDLSGSSNPATITMSSNKSVTAVFEALPPQQYSLTVSVAPSGSGSVARSPSKSTYASGEQVTLTAVPAAGYQFKNWLGDLSGSTNPATITMNSNKLVTAVFEATSGQQYSLSLTVSPASGGSVTHSPEKATYSSGEEITLTAFPAAGYQFKNWSGSLWSTANPTSITMNSNTTVTAVFEAVTGQQYSLTVTVSPAGAGSVTRVPDRLSYSPGEQVTLTAVAATGYTFTGWSGDLTGSANPATLALDWSKVITAHFAEVLAAVYVDDDATTDPGPYDPGVSDPQENGSPERPYDSVQEALEAAADGATVVVLPGVYLGTIDPGGKDLLITSLAGVDPDTSHTTSPISNTILDGNGSGPVVVFDNGEGPECILNGFTIIGGVARAGAAIFSQGSAPTICHCVIAGNLATDPGGGAVACYESDAVFINCTIAHNCVGALAGGICCARSRLVVCNCILWENGPAAIVESSGNRPLVRYSDVEGGWPGEGNLNIDPLFVAPGRWANPANLRMRMDAGTGNAVWLHGDYHLRSRGGHYADGDWIIDLMTSPCIDSGDPNDDCAGEPAPNGGCINLGAYGGTREASKTATDTSGTAEPTGGLVAHWTLDEGSGNTVTDCVGAVAGVRHGAGWSSGIIGGALQFDGVDDYVDCGSAGVPAPEKMTLAFWMQGLSQGEDEYVLAKALPGLDEDYVVQYLYSTCIRFGFGERTAQGIKTVTASSGPVGYDRNWTHIAAVRDGSHVHLYLNGRHQTQCSRAYSFTPTNKGQPLTLGARSPESSSEFFKGKLDDIRIYDRALSAAEIEDFAQAGQ